MAAKKMRTKRGKKVATYKHQEAKRTNIPTAELQSAVGPEVSSPLEVAIGRRNRDLDPQLVWRGKDELNASDLVVPAPPLFIQEKVHPKVLIDDLLRSSRRRETESSDQIDLFADFNGASDEAKTTDFYQHEQNWTNRMILGDSLQVMASLAEREGLRGKVQCIYIDPPYGIRFNSNFQWSTTSRDVKDGKADHITREPEQVKAFRDTWRDGIHSYLTYLRDRLTVARELLTESGSVFVQIGDENVHRVRALMDEVFGEDNFLRVLTFKKTTGQASELPPSIYDHILWYAADRSRAKTWAPLKRRPRAVVDKSYTWFEARLGQVARATKSDPPPEGARRFMTASLMSSGASKQGSRPFGFGGREFSPSSGTHWKTHHSGLSTLARAGRLIGVGKTLAYRRFSSDYDAQVIDCVWTDTLQSTFSVENIYVVQTYSKVIQRCLHMATDPGDLVLDPTCGSGTMAAIAEQLGRRWITVDTSRVALALARARIMGARYPYYLLADSEEGKRKEAEISRSPPSDEPTHGKVRQGFVYERVPHITLKSIANNAEIDVIWEEYQEQLEPLRKQLNDRLGEAWEEWEIPREPEEEWGAAAKEAHERWWKARIARQKEIDASIAAKADFEFLYDKPYEDKSKVRVAGPFTVESLSPHRVLSVGADDELIDPREEAQERGARHQGFASMVLDNLKTAGVQQAAKEDRISFTSLQGWPGEWICAEGRYVEGANEEGEGGTERRAGIFVGPEFGTVGRQDLVRAAREAADAGFDAVIACAFSFDAHSAEFNQLGKVPILRARMNADLHMSGDLANTGSGNLFVIFGEPDIEIQEQEDGRVTVQIHGVDVFDPQSGKVRSGGPDDIACWFIDTDYNDESFFVRHAYFLGIQSDPYKALKTTLKAEIDAEAWETLNSDTSRPFPKPESGRIAVKVINHLGDEVMKVFRIE
ncbi:MAG: site-specific DNA-methyltransferase [Acidobacteria bacterium]|nr:MAG: site-specific DNA-methyltransferase [Acidobacteriota bacterium]